MKSLVLPIVFFFVSFGWLNAQVSITVDASVGHNPISPLIYGRNNNLSDDPTNPTTDSLWNLYKAAGLKMFRENGGNNSTKYNWRLKLSSHPDWYNNVYAHDWDYSASSLLTNTSNTQGLYAFQLLGKAASNTQHNFNDYAYTQANGYINTDSNWAGGGGPKAYGGNGGVGNPNLYLENWPADSTSLILDHWFNTLKYDQTRLQYWNMDNEPEIWSSTHDDVVTSPMPVDTFLQKYFTVAKAVRAKYPQIKLCGPVSPNEWQWYTWNNSKVTDPTDGLQYPWIQYFIKRVAAEEQASGVRLLDVLDFHFYPGTQNDPTTALQLHRVWFDSLFSFGNYANGVKVVGPYSWNSNVTSEYFFERCNTWLNQYMGANHGVKFSLSEYGSVANSGQNPNVVACWYASHLGVFANKGIEFFTPWDWNIGQWEVLHLFSNYYGSYTASAVSSSDSLVSAYSSLTANGDTLVIAVVNRDQNNAHTVNVQLKNFNPSQSSVTGYSLSNLPSTETFVSGTKNALKTNTYSISNNQLSFSTSKLSVTLIQIPTNQSVSLPTSIVNTIPANTVQIFPNPAKSTVSIRLPDENNFTVVVQNVLGQVVQSKSCSGNFEELDLSGCSSGTYFIQVTQNGQTQVKKIIKE